MANLNKENIVIVDVKNATVSTSGSMSFYTTDVGTCNIYCQLVINESKNSLINKYAPIENSEDFNVRMGIIKPNFEPKYIDFSIRNAVEAFFCVELPDDCKDIDGEYKCELYVESNTTLESGEQQLEKITTAPFSYKVNKSIMSAIDDAIVGNLGQALLKTLATVAYVDDSIAEIPETDLLKDFATRSFVNEVLVQHNSEIAQRDYASKQHVKDMVDGLRFDISEANYASQSYVNEGMDGLSTSITNLLTRNYAPIAYVDYKIEDAISNIEVGGGEGGSVDLSNYVTKDELPPIRVIGSDDPNNPYIFTGNEFTEEEYANNTRLTVMFKNVVINYYSSENVRELRVDQLVECTCWYGDEGKTFAIDTISGHLYDFFIMPDGNIAQGVNWDYRVYHNNLQNYATNESVDEKIANAVMGNVDLSEYVTKDTFNTHVNGCVSYDDLMGMHYVTSEHVKENYTTKESMNTALADKADAEHTHDEYLTEHQDISNLATKEELSTALGNIETLLGEI